MSEIVDFNSDKAVRGSEEEIDATVFVYRPVVTHRRKRVSKP
jgi:hypothetical protein